MKPLKSLGAVAAGVAVNVLAVPVDAVLHAVGLLPAPGIEWGDGPLLFAFTYRAALAVLGGSLTARLAPAAPLAHGFALGALGVVLSSLGAAAQWGLGHHWYPLALIAMSLPASLAGARLTTRS